uniref:ATP synthase CF0 subunit I n=1 Tax=Glaukea argentea TaxID=2894057 RepID=A0A386B1I1_9CHLO|nr:ATP synthase CF0 subunit I [Udotea argentea]AYC65564.1 ATP synthase CF0 subunit I [Udotea argentea]
MKLGLFKQIFLKQIIIIVVFVGRIVRSLLSKRQKSVFTNLQQAKDRNIKIEQSYFDAQIKFKKASDEVIKIRRQTDEAIEQQKEKYRIKLSKNLQELEELKESKIKYQKIKIQQQISQKIITLALQKVEKKFQEKLDQNARKSITLWSIEQLKKF